MLIPVNVRANYKISTSLAVTLENLVGSNLPLLFPEVLALHRTPTTCNLTIAGQRSLNFINQVDPDFDGLFTGPLFTTFTLGQGLLAKLTGLDQSGLLPAAYGQTTVLTFTNAGPAVEARLTLVIKGLIESSVMPDPLAVVNV